MVVSTAPIASTRRPRIAIVGISHESSTFSRHRTRLEDFTVLRGAALGEALDLRGKVGDLVDTAEWVPIVRATTTPGGPVEPDAYDAIEAEAVAGLRELGPFDGVYLFLHGAIHVSGRDAAEERFVTAVRQAVGPDAVLSASMDTHGNFSPELAELLDLACAHRHAPHIDTAETHARAVRNLLAVLRDGIRPARAHVRIPVLLPGERTATNVEPGARVFGALLPAIERYGVLDANLFVGFFWADEPRNSAAAFVTGPDAASAAACAEELARGYWDARHDFGIVAERDGDWDAALDHALTRPPAPLYISDSGDNVSAGSSGDTTLPLSRTLARDDVRESGLRILFTGLVDPPAVEAAAAAGVDGVLDLAIGAREDDRAAGPVAGPWRVLRLLDGLSGEGLVGALLGRADADRPGVEVIVQRDRQYFLRPDDAAFRTQRMPGIAWVDPADYDVVVVKNGYLFPGQEAEAGSWFMAITPGGTDLDVDRLPFARIARPMFPLDDPADAELRATVLPAR